MAEKPINTQRSPSPDWFVRGVLGKLGEKFDGFVGRKWTPSSSLAASELIYRIKRLLDAEASEVPGKGRVVPHHIQLKIEWDKFKTDGDENLEGLRNELLTATIDHINDSLYYTYAPVEIEIKADYFIEGVKLAASFDGIGDLTPAAEMNVTVAGMNLTGVINEPAKVSPAARQIKASFTLGGSSKEKLLAIVPGQSISIGRIGSNGLVLDDASVSKTHASLLLGTDGTLSIADTGSTNGTFINEERIAYAKTMAIDGSDKVKFGGVEVTFELADAEKTLASTESDDAHQADTVEIAGFTFTSRPSAAVDEEEPDEAE